MTDHFSPKEVSCLTAWYPLAATRHRVVAYFGCFTENLPHMADVSDVPRFSSYPHRKRKLRVLCKRFWRFSVLQMHFDGQVMVLWSCVWQRTLCVGSGHSSSSFPAPSCLNTLWSVVPDFSLCTVSPSMLSLYCKTSLRMSTRFQVYSAAKLCSFCPYNPYSCTECCCSFQLSSLSHFRNCSTPEFDGFVVFGLSGSGLHARERHHASSRKLSFYVQEKAVKGEHELAKTFNDFQNVKKASTDKHFPNKIANCATRIQLHVLNHIKIQNARKIRTF